MDDIPPMVIYVLLLSGAILALVLWKQRKETRQLKVCFDELEGEEERMFNFLHDLGLAIGKEPTDVALSKIIVNGVLDVVKARGGAIYHIAPDHAALIPAYVLKDCPVLMGVPADVVERAETEPNSIESYLRRERVELNEGIFGHVLQNNEVLLVEDLKGHEAMLGASLTFTEDVAVMVAPMQYAGKDLGVVAVARKPEDGAFSRNDFDVFRSVAEQSSFAIGNARVHREANEKKAIEGELRNAREVQRVLLPQEDPVVAGFRVNGTNLPAKIISGDYYDYLDVGNGKLGVVVADVSGKGVSAGLLMAMCRSLLRAVSLTDASPSKVLAAVNGYLFPDIREDMFISLIYGVLDPVEGTMTFARAGHEPALVFRKNGGEVETLRPKGLALGIDGGSVFERVTEDEVIHLESGDCVLLFTDGVKEALDAHEEEFGMERLSAVFKEASPMGAEVVVQRVQQVVEDFAGEGPQMDDVTIVAIEKR